MTAGPDSDRLPPAPAPWVTAVAPRLLQWFQSNARPLPWRQTRDPYAIWVSEIMLQQTQVKTVIPYWERWMSAFPDIASLAGAPEPRVLKLWEGLGYYRRARNLHRAAQVLVESFQGTFPRDPDAILELPGIGRYTLGAIGSIAFDLALPVLDGNVARVIARVAMSSHDPTTREGSNYYWGMATQLVNIAAQLPSRHSPALAGNCSAINQALMELGATVCTPQSPECGRCPISNQCAAFQNHVTAEYPRPRVRPTITRRHLRVWIVLDQDRTRVLVRQRPAHEVNGNLWEFPGMEVLEDTTSKSSDTHAIPEDAGLGMKVESIELPVLKLQHSITRYRFHVEASFHQPLKAGNPRPGKGLAWVDRAELEALAMTAAHRKLAGALPETGSAGGKHCRVKAGSRVGSHKRVP